MSKDMAYAYIGLKIAQLAKSPNPAPDRTFLEGDIDKAEFLGQVTYQEAALYRGVLAFKACDRVETIRSAA
jgi:hypothetical protein